jgi:protein arginine kinase activator
MECQFCKANEATIHFKQVMNGAVKELAMCMECAAERGFNPEAPAGLTDFLFSISGKDGPQAATHAEDVSCPSCHMHYGDFRKTSRLGCPACYGAFASDLGGVIASMQRGRRYHKGRVPSWVDMGAEKERLKGALREAVAAQNFEEAAHLRDRLRSLERAADAVQKKEQAT